MTGDRIATEAYADGLAMSGTTDGWHADTNTWKYASATLIVVPGDQRSYLGPGTKLSYNDGAVDYAVALTVGGVNLAVSLTGVASTVGTSLFTKVAHGLSIFGPVTIGGLVNTTGVTNDVVYWPVNITTDTFQLAHTPGGAAITLGGTADAAITVGPATLITTETNPNYSVANATLTAPRYSHEKTPIGFPLVVFSDPYPDEVGTAIAMELFA